MRPWLRSLQSNFHLGMAMAPRPGLQATLDTISRVGRPPFSRLEISHVSKVFKTGLEGD